MRQQQYFRDGKSHLPKSDADRIVVDFVRFKAQRYFIENLVDRGDGETLFSQLLKACKRPNNGNYVNNFRRDFVELVGGTKHTSKSTC